MADIDILAQQAIQASLCNLHDKAININQEILRCEPRNLGAMNRLGKCYFLINDLDKAKKYYHLALTIDPYNVIAKKNLNLINKSKNNHLAQNNFCQNCYEFLEIPGKTQTINLIRLPEQDRICYLKVGQLVTLSLKKRSVRVYCDQFYIGSLPEDVSQRLLHLIADGNKYKAYVRSIDQNKVSLFIKEVYQSKKNQNQTSFPHTLHDNTPDTLTSVLI